MKHKVYLIGAGPGHPGLITVRGSEILRQADVVIYDYLVDKRILQEAQEEAELICCDTLGKDRYSDGFLKHNEKIGQLVVKKVREGKRVIRLKNGDVSIFSRTGQELEALAKNRIDFEIVPGVTAASGASGYSGIPLTDRRYASSCIFITGHEEPGKKKSSIDWDKISGSGTIVLYMAVGNLGKIVKCLIAAGKDKFTPVAIIQDAAILTQKVLLGTLTDIAAKAKREKIQPPAIIIIGEVVKLEEEFNWLRKNKKILFTGLSQERFFEKDIYFHLPLIDIKPLSDYSVFDNYLRGIKEFDWIVFTSRYAVEYFFKRLRYIGRDIRVLAGLKIAVIGKSTQAKIEGAGILADVMPKKESSQGLLAEFKKIDIRGKKIFLPRSDISDKGLEDGLKKFGANVSSSVAYKNIPAQNLPDLDLGFFDEIMFTSPSGVRSFVKRYKNVPNRVKVRCIGEVTLKEAREWALV